MSKKFTAPKRRIERVRNKIDDSIISSESTLVLHTAEDAKTLVRTIIDLWITRDDATTGKGEWHMILQLAQRGTKVYTAVNTSILDGDASIGLLWESAGVTFMHTAAGESTSHHIQVDLKSMRKMSPQDDIQLVHISDANVLNLSGIITLFFKE